MRQCRHSKQWASCPECQLENQTHYKKAYMQQRDEARAETEQAIAVCSYLRGENERLETDNNAMRIENYILRNKHNPVDDLRGEVAEHRDELTRLVHELQGMYIENLALLSAQAYVDVEIARMADELASKVVDDIVKLSTQPKSPDAESGQTEDEVYDSTRCACGAFSSLGLCWRCFIKPKRTPDVDQDAYKDGPPKWGMDL